MRDRKIKNGEIYYTINAPEKVISTELKAMVDESILYDDHPLYAIKAQRCLIEMQVKLILKKHCE